MLLPSNHILHTSILFVDFDYHNRFFSLSYPVTLYYIEKNRYPIHPEKFHLKRRGRIQCIRFLAFTLPLHCRKNEWNQEIWVFHTSMYNTIIIKDKSVSALILIK